MTILPEREGTKLSSVRASVVAEPFWKVIPINEALD